jgi:hypothetical protein
VAAHELGDVLRRDAMQVDVNLAGRLDRGPRLQEWPGGPRRSMERGHGSQIRGPGAGRIFQPAPYPEREQARHASRPSTATAAAMISTMCPESSPNTASTSPGTSRVGSVVSSPIATPVSVPARSRAALMWATTALAAGTLRK